MSSREPFESHRSSRDLLDILGATRGIAGAFYEGALRTMADPANPTRARMAAYACREVIEQLEIEAGIEENGRPGLSERVIALRKSWQAVPRAADGSLEGSLAVAEMIDRFFKQYDADYSSRRARADMTIVALDPTGRQGPPAVRSARIDALMEFRQEFNATLHGTGDTSGFYALMERFEGFLLAWLRPRPSESFNEIDDLLRQGPPHG